MRKSNLKEGYIIRDQTLPHFITATVVDWIDVFTRQNYRDIVIDCFDYCIKNNGMILYNYVIMSNPWWRERPACERNQNKKPFH